MKSNYLFIYLLLYFNNSTAKLNPNNEFYCLPSNEIGRSDIYIPIILNNTIPKKVSVSRYDYNSHSKKIISFSSDKLQRGTEVGQGKQGLEIYYIRINEPGVYKLDNIITKDGMDIRLYNRLAYVFTCPTAQFQSSSSSSLDYCKGDKDSVQLEVTGVPPLRVEYTRRVGDIISELKIDHIQPTDTTFESPLTSLSSGLQDASPSFFIATNEDNNNYDWAAGKQLSIQLNVTFGTARHYDYQLKRVIDGAGNVVDLLNTPSKTFHVHDHPIVQFDCNQRYPLKLLIGQPSIDLPLNVKGSAPFTIEYEKLPDNNNTLIDDGSNMNNNNIKRDIKQVSFKRDEPLQLKASSPGEYKVLSLKDQFCKGNVLYPSSCFVTQPPLPTVELDTHPIPSECASGSEVGMKFVATFQGSPPYRLKYNVKKKQSKSGGFSRTKEMIDQLDIFTEKSRHIFTYLPKSSGDYIYEFHTLMDQNYELDPKINILEQTVHPQPDARFLDTYPRRTCLGDKLILNVELVGTAPYTLYWSFDGQTYSSQVDGNNHEISLPPFESPGRYVASLVKIEDKNGCVKELDSKDIVIDVRSERPKAFFTYEKKDQVPTLFIADEKTINLPLRFTGEGPWDITWQYIDEDGHTNKPVTKQLHNANAELQVSKTGTYRLLEMNDIICKGDVYNIDYNVKWMNRPTISIPEEQVSLISENVFERTAICQGVEDAIDVQFSGNGPFTSIYDTFLHTPGSSSSLLSTFGRRDQGIKLDPHEITSGYTTARIPLITSSPGKYRYVFNQLADQRYTTLFKPSPVIQLQQTIYELPTVHFSSKSSPSSVRMMCVGDHFVSQEDPIWLEATGQPPFNIYLRVHHQDLPSTHLNNNNVHIMENITSHQFKLDLPGVLDTSGKYMIELLRIQDANHCASDVSHLPDTKLTLDALGIATITALDSCSEMCVGDQLEYSLSGEGPFTIVYEFNGQREKVKSTTTKFSMIADEPGNLTIVSVGNQRNKCQSFPKDTSTVIHPVPSSFVSGGKDIIENIHEGEMVQAIVDLVGTPPFDFEWKRSELIWDHAKKHHYKGRVLESHVVHGVEDYRYAINTSTEGVIEVVSIKDKYCQYPRA
ncbi:unnamed protein product [Cunninghamella blakesleeana]